MSVVLFLFMLVIVQKYLYTFFPILDACLGFALETCLTMYTKLNTAEFVQSYFTGILNECGPSSSVFQQYSFHFISRTMPKLKKC